MTNNCESSVDARSRLGEGRLKIYKPYRIKIMGTYIVSYATHTHARGCMTHYENKLQLPVRCAAVLEPMKTGLVMTASSSSMWFYKYTHKQQH